MTRLKAVKKDIKNIAFIGSNPDFFLKNMMYNNVEKFTFI